MLEVKNFHIRSVEIPQIVLEWEISPTFEHLDNYVFEVYRSGSPDNDWEKLATLVDAYYYVDPIEHMKSLLSKWFYKLVVRNIVKGDEVTIGPIWLKQPRDNDAVALLREVTRRNQMLLKNYIGQQAFILKRRTFGEHCTECWDPIKRIVTKSHCEACYRTGWKGGYFLPIPIYIGSQPESESRRISEMGIDETADNLFWTDSYPLLSPGDVLVLHETHIRYRIVNVQTKTAIQGACSRQIFSAKALPPSDIIYKVPIPSIVKYPHAIKTDFYPYSKIDNYDPEVLYDNSVRQITEWHTFEGDTNSYLLADEPAGKVIVSINGTILQEEGVDFNVNGRAVTFTKSVEELADTTVEINYLSLIQMAYPAEAQVEWKTFDGTDNYITLSGNPQGDIAVLSGGVVYQQEGSDFTYDTNTNQIQLTLSPSDLVGADYAVIYIDGDNSDSVFHVEWHTFDGTASTYITPQTISGMVRVSEDGSSALKYNEDFTVTNRSITILKPAAELAGITYVFHYVGSPS